MSRRLLWMTTVALRIFSVSLIRNPLKRNRFFLLHHISLILSHDVALISSKTRIGKPYRRLLKVFFHLSSKTIRLHVLVPTYGKLSLELFLFRETKGFSIHMWIILNCVKKWGEEGGREVTKSVEIRPPFPRTTGRSFRQHREINEPAIVGWWTLEFVSSCLSAILGLSLL